MVINNALKCDDIHKETISDILQSEGSIAKLNSNLARPWPDKNYTPKSPLPKGCINIADAALYIEEFDTVSTGNLNIWLN